MEGECRRRRNLLKLNVHLVWATKNRLPLIEASVERRLHRNIAAMFRRYEGTVLAIDGMPDHVHILVSLSPKYALSEVIKNVKGSSSRFFSETLKPDAWFQWQPNYAAIHVGPSEVQRVQEYILRQKQHHADGTVQPEYEQEDEPDETSAANSTV